MSLSQSTRTILVVGGGVRIRDQLCLALSREGCLIRVTGNENAALTLIDQDAPDAVVLDPAVSEMGIPDFQQRLMDKNPMARLVLLIHANDNCKRLAWNGVRHFLKTPFTQSTLMSALPIRPRINPRL